MVNIGEGLLQLEGPVKKVGQTAENVVQRVFVTNSAGSTIDAENVTAAFFHTKWADDTLHISSGTTIPPLAKQVETGPIRDSEKAHFKQALDVTTWHAEKNKDDSIKKAAKAIVRLAESPSEILTPEEVELIRQTSREDIPLLSWIEKYHGTKEYDETGQLKHWLKLHPDNAKMLCLDPVAREAKAVAQHALISADLDKWLIKAPVGVSSPRIPASLDAVPAKRRLEIKTFIGHGPEQAIRQGALTEDGLTQYADMMWSNISANDQQLFERMREQLRLLPDGISPHERQGAEANLLAWLEARIGRNHIAKNNNLPDAVNPLDTTHEEMILAEQFATVTKTEKSTKPTGGRSGGISEALRDVEEALDELQRGIQEERVTSRVANTPRSIAKFLERQRPENNYYRMYRFGSQEA